MRSLGMDGFSARFLLLGAALALTLGVAAPAMAQDGGSGGDGGGSSSSDSGDSGSDSSTGGSDGTGSGGGSDAGSDSSNASGSSDSGDALAAPEPNAEGCTAGSQADCTNEAPAAPR